MGRALTAWPPLACDTHLHVYDHRFPPARAAILRPPDATLDDYLAFRTSLGLERAVLVQPTTYGLDNRLHETTLRQFGSAARGVAVVDDTTTTAELRRLDDAGFRGARFHMLPGGAVPWSAMEPVAARVADIGWHIQLQLDGRELAGHLDRLRRLPTALVIDHVGRFMPPVGVSDPAFEALLTLLDEGTTWVKLSAPYESSVEGPPEYRDVSTLARALVRHAPERLLWASNWPHPGQADPPSADGLRRLLGSWVPDPETRTRILVDNPAQLYGF